MFAIKLRKVFFDGMAADKSFYIPNFLFQSMDLGRLFGCQSFCGTRTECILRVIVKL